jgi:2,4-dienoyl-CoA reductase (NADPH2)
VAQGSIVEVSAADDLLERGVCDGVEMTRAHIADPDVVARTRGEVAGPARPCTLCNQGCQVRDVRNPILSCAVNAVAGHELTEADVSNDGALTGRTVSIAGGGVAGLVTARAAALRGARVTIHESSAALGGALVVAADLPGGARWRAFLEWLTGEVDRLGVTVETSSAAHAADIVAVGRTTATARFRDGSDASVPVLDATDAMRSVGYHSVAVLDLVGDGVGVGVAERLAAGGSEVTVVTPDLVAGVQLSLTGDLVAANTRLAVAGVTVVTHTVAVAVADGALILEDRFSGATRALRVDAVVHAGFDVPALDPPEGVIVGDALAPRTVNAAVREGHRAALALSTLDAT